MFLKTIQDFWLYANLLFILNYSLTLLGLLLSFPVPRLPSFFNNALLIVAYLLTFHGLLKESRRPASRLSFLSKASSQPNTFCLIVFFTFIPNILLLPFFILSIYHTTAAVLGRKADFEAFFFFNIFVAIHGHLNTLGRLAMLLELVLTPVAFLLFFFGRLSIFSLLSYTFMVRRQCVTNSTMKSIVEECLCNIHAFMLTMPEGIKMRYFKVINYFKAITKKEEPNKKQE